MYTLVKFKQPVAIVKDGVVVETDTLVVESSKVSLIPEQAFNLTAEVVAAADAKNEYLADMVLNHGYIPRFL